MGKSNDSMAVVDTKGRVFGTTGLRVVDSSALPFLPPGHPQAVICKYFIIQSAGLAAMKIIG